RRSHEQIWGQSPGQNFLSCPDVVVCEPRGWYVQNLQKRYISRKTCATVHSASDWAIKRGTSSGLIPGWESSKPFIDRDDPGCRIISAHTSFTTRVFQYGHFDHIKIIIRIIYFFS